ncbi:hypothetical protein [Pseudomonas sp. 2FG]|uniref:hypothetical protein n=1 Tax=Pseudomonas sp. 2FG TaxID=2502191 RepID=UPI0015AD8EE6|nr:hypothetical protein [Pseudomonas sp. 2FG]
MAESIELESPRLLLRVRRDADLQPLATLSADPLVMESFPTGLSRTRWLEPRS